MGRRAGMHGCMCVVRPLQGQLPACVPTRSRRMRSPACTAHANRPGGQLTSLVSITATLDEGPDDSSLKEGEDRTQDEVDAAREAYAGVQAGCNVRITAYNLLRALPRLQHCMIYESSVDELRSDEVPWHVSGPLLTGVWSDVEDAALQGEGGASQLRSLAITIEKETQVLPPEETAARFPHLRLLQVAYLYWEQTGRVPRWPDFPGSHGGTFSAMVAPTDVTACLGACPEDADLWRWRTANLPPFHIPRWPIY